MKKFVSPYGATTRRNVVLAVLAVFAASVLGKVGYLQLDEESQKTFAKESNKRFLRVRKEAALRGNVLDRNAVPLAVSTPVSSVWADPYAVDYSTGNLKAMADTLGYSVAKLKKRLDDNKVNAKNEEVHFVYLRRGIEPAVAEKHFANRFDGVHLQREYRRFYPSADVVSQIIGYANDDDAGISGVELLWNGWLSGQSGSSQIVKDPKGRVVDVLQEISPPVQGQDLMLTIDKRIQYLTYLALLEAAEKFSAESATAVVLDAKTSEVLAMVSVPSGNPNNPKERNPDLIKNRAITDSYEPGSVMKPFVAAAALDAGLVNPSTPVDTRPGRMRLGKNTITDTHNYGKLNVSTVIKKSSNVGSCKIALRMPRAKLHAMYSGLGFGEKSQMGFPGEQSGLLRSFKRLNDFSYCTAAYGYGLSATTLQIAQAYAVLANDGVKIPASLIKRESLPTSTRVMQKRTARQVRKMLAKAVGEGGTGTRATLGEYMQDYSVGGKTGTAHKVINKHYSKTNYRSVFAGMAPLSDPRIVMVVVVDDPKGKQYYGGLVAAPVFAKVVGKSLRILGVAPDRKLEKKEKTRYVKDQRQ